MYAFDTTLDVASLSLSHIWSCLVHATAPHCSAKIKGFQHTLRGRTAAKYCEVQLFFALVLSETRLWMHRSWSKPRNLESIKTVHQCTSTKACPGHNTTVRGRNAWEPTSQSCQSFTRTSDYCRMRLRNMLRQNKKIHLISWNLHNQGGANKFTDVCLASPSLWLAKRFRPASRS